MSYYGPKIKLEPPKSYIPTPDFRPYSLQILQTDSRTYPAHIINPHYYAKPPEINDKYNCSGRSDPSLRDGTLLNALKVMDEEFAPCSTEEWLDKASNRLLKLNQ